MPRANEKAKGKPIGWFTARLIALRQLGFVTYGDYLLSPLWQGIRAKVISRARYLCRICRKRRAVQVHHQSYGMDTLQGITLEHLVALCPRCHRCLEFKGKVKRSFVMVVELCTARLKRADRVKVKAARGKTKPKAKAKPKRR